MFFSGEAIYETGAAIGQLCVVPVNMFYGIDGTTLSFTNCLSIPQTYIPSSFIEYGLNNSREFSAIADELDCVVQVDARTQETLLIRDSFTSPNGTVLITRFPESHTNFGTYFDNDFLFQPPDPFPHLEIFDGRIQRRTEGGITPAYIGLPTDVPPTGFYIEFDMFLDYQGQTGSLFSKVTVGKRGVQEVVDPTSGFSRYPIELGDEAVFDIDMINQTIGLNFRQNTPPTNYYTTAYHNDLSTYISGPIRNQTFRVRIEYLGDVYRCLFNNVLVYEVTAPWIGYELGGFMMIGIREFDGASVVKIDNLKMETIGGRRSFQSFANPGLQLEQEFPRFVDTTLDIYPITYRLYGLSYSSNNIFLDWAQDGDVVHLDVVAPVDHTSLNLYITNLPDRPSMKLLRLTHQLPTRNFNLPINFYSNNVLNWTVAFWPTFQTTTTSGSVIINMVLYSIRPGYMGRPDGFNGANFN